MLSQLYNLMSSAQPDESPKDETIDPSLPTEVDADDFHLVEVSLEDGEEGNMNSTEDNVEPTGQETDQQETQESLQLEISNAEEALAQIRKHLEADEKEMLESGGSNDLLSKISNRDVIIAQLKMFLAAKDLEIQEMDSGDESIVKIKGLLEAKDREIKILESRGTNDLLNEISNRNAIIAQMKDLLSEKDGVLQEQGEIKEKEIENRDETIAQLKHLLKEKDNEINKLESEVVNDEALRNLVKDYKYAKEERAKIGIIDLRWFAGTFLFIAALVMTGFWNQFTFVIACLPVFTYTFHLALECARFAHPDTLSNSIMTHLTSSISTDEAGSVPEKHKPAPENPGPAPKKHNPAPLKPGTTRSVVLKKENGLFGMMLRDNMSITGSIPDSPADRAGIARGDEILSINGVNVEVASYDDVLEMLTGSVAETALIVRYNPQKLEE